MSEKPILEAMQAHAAELYEAVDALLGQIHQEDWYYPNVPAVRQGLAVMAKVRGVEDVEATVARELKPVPIYGDYKPLSPEQEAAMNSIKKDIGCAWATTRDNAIANLFDNPPKIPFKDSK